MIVTIRANKPSFQKIEFNQGFNVVLADRTKEATILDSRNGLGKTTLVEIIHFCLGARTRRNQGLMVPQLKGWGFSLDMYVDGREFVVTRNTDDARHIILHGDISDLPVGNVRLDGSAEVSVDNWNDILGEMLFGLTIQEPVHKYRPTYRSLFSYIARRSRESFVSPFLHHRSQRVWDKQVNNAFLLGLTWEHASKLQDIKDEDNLLNQLRRAAQSGLIAGMIGTLGGLEAERARLETDIRNYSASLESFRVHPRYSEIEREANDLTATIHELVNANLSDLRMLDLYRESLEDDQTPDSREVLEIYREIGVAMPELVRRRVTDVQNFHHQLLANRRAYLASEIQRINSNRRHRDLEIQRMSERRARLLTVMNSYGALQEHTRLNELYSTLIARRDEIDNRIANIQRFEQGKSQLRVDRELVLQTARREFGERRETREHAINTFNSNSEALYSAPGNLVIEVANTGFNFDVEIMRSGSQGIDNMKVFCYDLMLAQLWSDRQPNPGMLIHDSTIFDGVDERQFAQALELAQRESDRLGFQYICALNSDTLPQDDFSPDFDINGFVKRRLTDESEDGGLLGIRY